MKKINNFTYFGITFLFFTFTNFYLSNLIINKVKSGWEFSNSLINIVYVENTGAAFSMLQNSTSFLIALSLIALVVIFVFMIKNSKKLCMIDILFISFLISGIFGNLYERLHFGFVRDFFELAFVNFPIFNISDVFINIGVFGIIILILLAKNPIKMT